jgi:hypothetical protein
MFLDPFQVFRILQRFIFQVRIRTTRLYAGSPVSGLSDNDSSDMERSSSPDAVCEDRPEPDGNEVSDKSRDPPDAYDELKRMESCDMSCLSMF